MICNANVHRNRSGDIRIPEPPVPYPSPSELSARRRSASTTTASRVGSVLVPVQGRPRHVSRPPTGAATCSNAAESSCKPRLTIWPLAPQKSIPSRPVPPCGRARTNGRIPEPYIGLQEVTPNVPQSEIAVRVTDHPQPAPVRRQTQNGILLEFLAPKIRQTRITSDCSIPLIPQILSTVPTRC